MFVGGVQGYMTDNTAVDGDEKEWSLMAFDPVWTKNSAILALDYNNGKYGGFFSFGAEDWSGNIEGGLSMSFNYLAAYAWREFFDGKFKASLGILPDYNMQTQEKVWKAEGASNGGWSINDNYENYASLRLEYKPVKGLNVGTQVNFLPLGQSTRDNMMPDLPESLKEVTLAAEYKGDLFNALVGTRFDGADGINKFDAWTYLKDYYGEWGYIGGGMQNGTKVGEVDKGGGNTYDIIMPMAPVWKHKADVYGTSDGSGFATANADKPFSGSQRVVVGFNFKGVKNLTAKMQGSLWNLGDFDRFDTGAFDETIAYSFTPKLNVGMNFFQEFYGKDAFPDDYVNSPYFRFQPTVSYDLVPFAISANFAATYGIAKDVIDYYWNLKPGFVFTLGGFGALRLEVYYEVESTAWTQKAIDTAKAQYIFKFNGREDGKPVYAHKNLFNISFRIRNWGAFGAVKKVQ
jgi:hypothetical protein